MADRRAKNIVVFENGKKIRPKDVSTKIINLVLRATDKAVDLAKSDTTGMVSGETESMKWIYWTKDRKLKGTLFKDCKIYQLENQI